MGSKTRTTISREPQHTARICNTEGKIFENFADFKHVESQRISLLPSIPVDIIFDGSVRAMVLTLCSRSIWVLYFELCAGMEPGTLAI